MSNELRKVEYQSISGIQVELDADTVIKYCARGNGNITPQEVALFLRTCQAKRLDPLENGEVYLIKYDNTKPAQIVVGKHAYLRRADRNPEYRGKKSGIVIVRDGKVIQKEGCCLYKVLNETLIGGWCRVFRRRAGADVDEEFYREVALEEYSSGQANWKVKPATMIEKVAVSQCLRDAFPNDYEGLYSLQAAYGTRRLICTTGYGAHSPEYPTESGALPINVGISHQGCCSNTLAATMSCTIIREARFADCASTSSPTSLNTSFSICSPETAPSAV